MNLFKKKKGVGLVSVIFVLGIVVFTAAVVVPKVTNRGNLSRQKNMQVAASTILKDAKSSIKQADLPALGILGDVALTDQVFNSLEVVNVVNFLNARGILKGFKAANITTNNPNINLGNLKVLTNVPAKKIIIDSNGYLVKEPYIVQK